MLVADKALSEKQFQQRVTDLCDVLHLRYYHTYDSRRSPSGFPDLVIVGPTGCIFVELKKENGKVTTRQQEWLDDLRTAGQVAVVWHPSDWGWAKRFLFSLAGKKAGKRR